jgi:hypothetical protein
MIRTLRFTILATALFVASAHAQSYPIRPVRVSC